MMRLRRTPAPVARPSRRRLAGALTALAALTAPLAVPAADAAPSRALHARPTSRTPVMGPNLLNAKQLARWYRDQRGGVPPRVPSLDNNLRKLARLFIEEGRKEGVRGDMAFVQSIIETGWFSFPDYGQIRPWFNNFAGINAYNGRPPGTSCAAETRPSRCFATARLGIRNQIHLLRGYADPTTRNMPDRLRMPPSDRIGVAPIWELFGGASGRAIWATDPLYGTKIIILYTEALIANGARSECLPYSQRAVDDPSGRGYWVTTSDGGVFSFGNARFHGSPRKQGLRLAAPITGAESTPTGAGYWLLGRDGGIFTYGDAEFYGSTGNLALRQPVNGMERTRSGRGYWLVADDGGVFTFGNARFHGSAGALPLAKPIVGMERTRSGRGYWLVASDGGIFTYGDAEFHGSLGNRPPDRPVVAMQRTPSGEGYWLLDAAGKVYAFGNARHRGDLRGCRAYEAAAGLLVTPDGRGYWIVTREGSVIPLGDARRLGMPALIEGNAVGIVRRPKG